MPAFFDWMGCTIEEYPGVIVDACMTLPGAYDIRRGRGMNNYRERAAIIDVDGEVIASVLHGGSNGAPHAFASGDASPAFTDLVRSTWADRHRVTRLDTAQDVRTDFGTARAELQAFARQKSLKGHSQLPDDPIDGGSYNIGAPSSSVRLRLYEKGKQLAKLARSTEGYHLDTVRYELQVRPVREGKLTAARLSPDQAWGVTPWAREIAQTHLAAYPDRVVMQRRLPTSFERTHRAMLDQYGAHLRDLLASAGSTCAFGEQLALDLAGGSLSDGL